MAAGGATTLRTRSGAADLITQLQYAHRQLMDLVGLLRSFPCPIPCINTQHVSLVWAEYYTANLLLMITTCDSTKVKSLGYKYSISIYYDMLSLACLIYKGRLFAYFERPLINSFGFWALWEYMDLVPAHRLQNYLWLFETVYFLYVCNLL